MKKLLLPLLFVAALLQAVKVNSQTTFSSYPSATATIFLDFDGEDVYSPIWNRGVELKCAPAVLSSAQIQEIYNRVAEDYRPFNVNITTDESVFVAAPLNKRIRVIVTSTSAWFTGVGGIAYVGSFNWGDDTPCFVFSDRLGNSDRRYGGRHGSAKRSRRNQPMMEVVILQLLIMPDQGPAKYPGHPLWATAITAI